MVRQRDAYKERPPRIWERGEEPRQIRYVIAQLTCQGKMAIWPRPPQLSASLYAPHTQQSGRWSSSPAAPPPQSTGVARRARWCFPFLIPLFYVIIISSSFFRLGFSTPISQWRCSHNGWLTLFFLVSNRPVFNLTTKSNQLICSHFYDTSMTRNVKKKCNNSNFDAIF
jgi:hypothetical protein